MSHVRFERVSKRFGDTSAVRELSLEVERGELFAILGPSGCGKSTALRIAAGFLAPDEGRVFLAGRDVTRTPPERRDAAMVFQSYALFPHLDVGENVAFGLRARGIGGAALGDRRRRALELVDLGGYERREVGSLSGGEQQRVALARAIVVEPQILLLDEPMSNLDPKLRAATRRDLRALQKRLGITALYVTHDQEEALEIADRVAVLERGGLVQTGRPRDLYDRPGSTFVATFVGQANVLEAVVREAGAGGLVLEFAGRRLRSGPAPLAPGRLVRLAVRPESVLLGDDGADAEALGEGVVQSIDFLGPTLEMRVGLDNGPSLRVVALNRGGVPAAGARVRLAVPRDRLVVLGE